MHDTIETKSAADHDLFFGFLVARFSHGPWPCNRYLTVSLFMDYILLKVAEWAGLVKD